MSNRSNQIVTLVSALHKGLAINLDSPVDASAMARALGGKVIVVSDDEIEHEACIEKKGETFEIKVKDFHPPRMTFSIAHELGHLFLHMGYMTDEKRFAALADGHAYDRNTTYEFGKTEEEYEANSFASELLMPRLQFLEAVRLFSSAGSCDIPRLANRFGVSKQAAVTRGRWLGVFAWD